MAFLVKSSHPLSYHKIIYPAWKLKICESHIKTFNLNIFTCWSTGIAISPTVQYCSSASKYSAARGRSTRSRFLLHVPPRYWWHMMPVAESGLQGAYKMWRPEMVHILGLSKFPTVLWVALTSASDDRNRMLLRSPMRQKRFKIVCVIVWTSEIQFL